MDTAQLATAAETDPNAQIELGAQAFKAFTSEEPVKLRDDQGRFAAAEETAEPEAEAELAEAEGEAPEDDQETAEEAQSLPPSWPADQAEHWDSLPPETQSFLAEREGERERAVQAKFQESANVRKAAEAAQTEAQNNRKQYADALDVVLSAFTPEKPDPRAYGAGTGQYDRESYDLALAAYEQQAPVFSQLLQQRQAIDVQSKQEADQAFGAWKQEVEATYGPKLLADVPVLTDPEKAEPLLRELIHYAIGSGFPESLFAPDNQKNITSPEIHTLWKAQQYDKLRAADTKAKPKPASPAVKPGVSSPRSAQKNAQRSRDFDRLSRDGSIESGAAVFKHFLR